MKNSTLFERITKIASDHGYKTLNDFALNGLKYQSSQKLNRLKDPNNSPSVEILTDISNKFEDVSLDWLITGKEKNYTKTEKFNMNSNLNERNKEYQLTQKLTPLIALEAFAGFGSAHFKIEEKDVVARYKVPAFESIDFMIPVKGTSMAPTYNNGDIVACRIISSSQFIQWNRTFVIATKEQGIICKRLKKAGTSGSYIAISDNKEYEPFEIPKDEITGLAMVVGTIKIE